MPFISLLYQIVIKTPLRFDLSNKFINEEYLNKEIRVEASFETL